MADRAERITCVHADRCGGCPAIDLAYGEQLAQKHARVVRAFARYPSLEAVRPDDVIGADAIASYRTRAKLVVSNVGAEAAIGLFAKGPRRHEVVDIPSCRVLSPVIARVTAAVRERATGHAPGLRAIDVREITRGALLTFVVDRGADLAALRDLAREVVSSCPDVLGVAASLHDGSPQVLGRETIALSGIEEGEDRIGDVTHLATFGSFVQAHRAQAVRVHELVSSRVGRGRVLDLYAGSGAISLSLATNGNDVTSVESFGPAAARITRAAERVHLSVRAVHSDAAIALREFLERGEKFDAVVANPPRRGVDPAARELVARLAPAVVAYVSCDPDTLARDLDHFARLGYRCESATPLDMIPLTEEVETIAIMRRAAPAAPRVLFEDDTAIFVEKHAHESASSKVEDLTARVRRWPRASEAVCVERLDRGASGVILYARSEAAAIEWRRAAAATTAHRVFLVGARGIVSSKGNLGRSKYRRETVFANHSLVRVTARGDGAGDAVRERSDVLRQRFARANHPVLGDARFGHEPTNRHFEEKYGLDRTFVHCTRVEIDHPLTNERVVVESPLPGDLQIVLDRAT